MGISDLNSKEQLQRNFQQASFFHQNGQLNKAQDIYLKILETHPNHFDSLYSLGIIACQTDDFQRAVDLFGKAIIVNPNNAFLYSNLSASLIELKQLDLAVTNYDKAIALDPNNADYHYNRATILQELKQLDLALASYDRAIELNSGDADYYYNRGNVLKELRQAVLAVVSYNKAIFLRPHHIESYINHGNALFELKQLDEAINSYKKAIHLNPNYAESYYNLGNALTEAKQLNAAIISYEKALQLNPSYKFLLGIIFHIKSKICDWTDYDKNSKKLEIKLQNKELVSVPFPILSIHDFPDLQLLVAKICAESENFVNILNPISKKPRSKKIRIGYYSADFRCHAVSYLMAGLFETHDKSKFEIIAFSFSSNAQDKMRERVMASFDKFIDVTAQSDIEITKLSRELEIDIAVDLQGFTQDMRLGIFSQRAAPIQVNYLGYPGTMGVPYIDYIVADKILIPEGNQKYYSEKIVYLPNSYQVNDSRKISDKIFTRREFELPEKGFIYCCFNNNYKITPQTFDSWMGILKAVENSVLWLSENNPIADKNLQMEAEKKGVNSSRLIFAKRVPLEEDHLARHKLADLFLDTLPYNAHTTCSDALWAGLPVLTLIGQSFASRVAASLLNAVNLPELITNTKEEYENLAIELATNPEKLKSIKEKLEKNRLTTPLFNTKIFTNHIEAAYEDMYDRYQNDLLPDNIEVKDLSLNT